MDFEVIIKKFILFLLATPNKGHLISNDNAIFHTDYTYETWMERETFSPIGKIIIPIYPFAETI